MTDNETRHDKLARLWDKIKDIRVAMMTTEDEGVLRSRPMATQQAEMDDALWFFTRAESDKTDEIEADHDVNLSYADTGKELYVSVSGLATVIDDRAKAAELWSPVLKAWFPDGLDDPALRLIRVAPLQAEYWDSPDGRVVQLVGLAKALVTGETYEPGRNEKLDF